MSLTVKAYLETKKNAERPEIRRFAVDPAVSSNFAYLSQKLAQAFPGLSNKKHSLFWKDPEGDQIAFSSDDELMEALGFVNDGIFKVYIQVEGDDGDDSEAGPVDGGNLPNMPHPHVVCDGCNGPVCGVRYKCSVCPDYDLCSTCQGKGMHKEHDMTRIATPVMPNLGPHMQPWMAALNGLLGQHPPPHGPHGGPPHGGPFHGGPPHGGPPFHPGMFGGPGMPPPPPYSAAPGMPGATPPPPPPPPGAPRPQHRRWMRQCWKNWWDNAYGDQDQGQSDQAKKGKGPGKGAQEKTQKAESQGTSASTSGAATDGMDQGNESPTEDYLANVGESVAALLDPLGIDVEVDVEHKGNRRRCRTQTSAGAANWGPWGNMMGAFWGGQGQGQEQGQGPCHGFWGPFMAQAQAHAQAQSQTTSTQGQTEGQGEKPPTTSTDTEMKDTNAETGESPIVKPTPTEPSAPEVQATDSQATRSSPTHSDGSADDWTLLGKERSAMETDGDQAPSSSTQQSDSTPRQTGSQLYPDIPSVTAPSNPRFAEALDHLKAMGFNDDGGWLSRLIEAKGGDINKVLDAIRPRPQ